MPKAIPCIPHVQRMETHKLEYLRAINMAINYPFQSEDGREPSADHSALARQCKKLTEIENWLFTNCCTDSLQIAFHTLCNPGDTVIIPAYGWRAIANAPRFMQMQVIYCDIDETGNLCPFALEEWAKNKSNSASALIVIHNFGTMAKMSHIISILKTYRPNMKIIEDAAPSFYMDAPIDYKPGQASDLVCYSFDFTKGPGTLGAGGGIATRHADIHERIYEIQAHGTSKQKQIVGVGTKSFLDNTSCAVLLKEIQLYEQFEYREQRRQVATWYNNNLPFNSIPGENYVWERFSMFVPSDKVGNVLDKLHSIKCLARTMFKEPMSSFPFYDAQEDLPGVKNFTENLIHLPSHHFMKHEELVRIAETLNEAV